MTRRPFALFAFLLLAAAAPARAQGPPGCTAPEHRQFDFWIGSWDVTTPPDGRVAGTNEIVSAHKGCALIENWVGAGGGSGTSQNFYLPSTGKWYQNWIGAFGQALWLSGGLDAEGRMVLSSDPAAGPIQRITWTANPDGTVRQAWETSADGGATWTYVFVGEYAKRD